MEKEKLRAINRLQAQYNIYNALTSEENAGEEHDFDINDGILSKSAYDRTYCECRCLISTSFMQSMTIGSMGACTAKADFVLLYVRHFVVSAISTCFSLSRWKQ